MRKGSNSTSKSCEELTGNSSGDFFFDAIVFLSNTKNDNLTQLCLSRTDGQCIYRSKCFLSLPNKIIDAERGRPRVFLRFIVVVLKIHYASMKYIISLSNQYVQFILLLYASSIIAPRENRTLFVVVR